MKTFVAVTILIACLTRVAALNECASNPCKNGATCVDWDVGHYTCLCNGLYEGENCDEDPPSPTFELCEFGHIYKYDNSSGFEYHLEFGPIEHFLNCKSLIRIHGATAVNFTFTTFDIETNKDIFWLYPGFNSHTTNEDIVAYPGFDNRNPPWNNFTVLYEANYWMAIYTDKNIASDGFNLTIIADSGVYDVCLISDPCLNGGTCHSFPDHYECTCPEGYTGVNCEIVSIPCESCLCENGGSCVDTGDGVVCECLPGFVGDYCETDVNECSSLPCWNGGKCIDGPGSYTCQCQLGFTGINCETVGYCGMTGEWYNESNDKVTLTVTTTGLILGDFQSNLELLTGSAVPTVVVGYANQNCEFPTFGFAVTRDNGQSTTTWSGQCHLCDGEEVLYATWTTTQSATSCAEIKTSTLVGLDKWTRYQQSTAPRQDA